MKLIQFIVITVIFFSFVVYYGCNSKGYEIEEIVDTVNVPIKEEVTEQKVEIKEETVKSPRVENHVYSIQIGAFEFESNASDFLNRASQILTYKMDYKLIDGLYKVRSEIFRNKNDAESILSNIRNLGFSDAFIIVSQK